MNKVILLGRLARKVELRFSNDNKAIGKFSLAVKRNYKNEDGKYGVDFINCSIFGKQAETLTNYTDKGSQIALDGRILTGSYEDKDGNTRYTTEVVVDRFDFIDKKNEETTEQQQEPQAEYKDPFETYGDSVSIDDDFLN